MNKCAKAVVSDLEARVVVSRVDSEIQLLIAVPRYQCVAFEVI